MKLEIVRWGSDLAVRLPEEFVTHHKLKEGDHIEIRPVDQSPARSMMSREQALERIKALQRPLPPDWKFDREDANSR